jgi:hypothetical protein
MAKYTLEGASLIDLAHTFIARAELYGDDALLELREMMQRNIKSGDGESPHSRAFMSALIAFIDDELLDRFNNGSI